MSNEWKQVFILSCWIDKERKINFQSTHPFTLFLNQRNIFPHFFLICKFDFLQVQLKYLCWCNLCEKLNLCFWLSSLLPYILRLKSKNVDPDETRTELCNFFFLHRRRKTNLFSFSFFFVCICCKLVNTLPKLS